MAIDTPQTWTQTTVGTPVAPSTESMFDLQVQAPLIRELVKEGLVDEPTMNAELSSARSFFTGQSMIDSQFMLSNLQFGQELRVNIRKDQNPFSLYTSNELEYETVDTCHKQLDLDCTVPCINTLPEIEYLTFKFDTEYAYGVRACDKNKDFWDYTFFTNQYALSRRAEQFGREVDLWNKVIKGLVSSPATTVDAKIAAAHATHYWSNLGTVASAARKAVPMALYYHTNSYAGMNDTVFITAEFATELVESIEVLNPTSINFTPTRVNTFEAWELPGFELAPTVKGILGINNPVVVLKRSPWLTTESSGTFTSQYPLWSSDATKQYVAILDPRVGYFFEKDGYHLVIKPYDCDKLVNGMIDTEYVGSGITMNTFGLILEFDAYDFGGNES